MAIWCNLKVKKKFFSQSSISGSVVNHILTPLAYFCIRKICLWIEEEHSLCAFSDPAVVDKHCCSRWQCYQKWVHWFLALCSPCQCACVHNVHSIHTFIVNCKLAEYARKVFSIVTHTKVYYTASLWYFSLSLASSKGNKHSLWIWSAAGFCFCQWAIFETESVGCMVRSGMFLSWDLLEEATVYCVLHIHLPGSLFNVESSHSVQCALGPYGH